MTISKLFFVFSLSLFFTCNTFAFGKNSEGDSFVDTGSWGDFTPRAFLQADKRWPVFRAVGEVSKGGFPCDFRGGSCFVRKNYRFETVTPQQQQRVAEIGVGWPIFDVERSSTGTLRTIQILNLNNRAIARMDKISSSGRLGVEGGFTISAQRINPTMGNGEPVGQVEGRDTAWSSAHPSSYYYILPKGPVFGMTTVSDMMWGGLVQNFFSNNPGARGLLNGTFWCHSDQWKLSEGILESLILNETFDMNSCKGSKIMSSETEKSVSELAANFFFNRVDSRVTLHKRNNYQYEVKTNREWICPFDCDGSVYQVNLPGHESAIAITSDRRTWTSSTKFKIKIVLADWDKDGHGLAISNGDLFGSNIDLRDIVNNPGIYKDIVAVIVSEIKDNHGMDSQGNGVYTQHTYIAFPPTVYGGVPEKYSKGLSKYYTEGESLDEFEHSVQLAYQMKILDSILAMMPDQVQTSPELADAEEKLDELMAFWRYKITSGNYKSISPDLVFDILSESDSTTATSWQGPHKRKPITGKIEWILKKLKVDF